MGMNREEVRRAVRELGLSADAIRELPDADARLVHDRAYATFVDRAGQRWWWKAFRDVHEGWHVPSGESHLKLADIIPPEPRTCWFIPEDDAAPYPVWEATVPAIIAVLGDCYLFEYYLVARDYSWLVCECPYDILMGVGEPVMSTLAQLREAETASSGGGPTT